MPLSFRIGQIVEIISPPDGSGVQKGDLGTVASEEYRHMDDDNWRIDILWHPLGERRVMMTPMIRLYDNPMDRPNRSAGARETVRALSTVINATLPHALEDAMRDLERARMETEDLRTKSFSPYRKNVHTRDPRHRLITWREFAKELDDKCHELLERMDNARDIALGCIEYIDDGDGYFQDSRRARDAFRTVLDALDDS